MEELKPKGNHSEDSEIWNEMLKHYDGEQQISEGHKGSHNGEYAKVLLLEDGGVADSSSEVKGERRDNHGFSGDHIPLDESLFALQSVQEALEKEVLQFQEINKNVSSDDWVSDTETSSLAVETRKADLEKEVENIFKLKIEAEVEYTTILSVMKLKCAAVLEEQKGLATEQTQIIGKLEAAGNKAAELMKEAERVEDLCDEIMSADEVLQLQNGVCKYGLCFLVQLVLLLVVVGFFVLFLSTSCVEVVPT